MNFGCFTPVYGLYFQEWRQPIFAKFPPALVSKNTSNSRITDEIGPITTKILKFCFRNNNDSSEFSWFTILMKGRDELWRNVTCLLPFLPDLKRLSDCSKLRACGDTCLISSLAVTTCRTVESVWFPVVWLANKAVCIECRGASSRLANVKVSKLAIASFQRPYGSCQFGD